MQKKAIDTFTDVIGDGEDETGPTATSVYFSRKLTTAYM